MIVWLSFLHFMQIFSASMYQIYNYYWYINSYIDTNNAAAHITTTWDSVYLNIQPIQQILERK